MNDFIRKYIDELNECIKKPATMSSMRTHEVMRRCINVLGNDLKIDANIFYWDAEHMNEDVIMLIDMLEYHLSKDNDMLTKESDNTLKNKIFISHRTTDAKIAHLLERFLVDCGANRDSVFVSSLPGNGVNFEISKEIKENLKSSCLNIVLLSTEYYDSAYCQNEAGVIWFLDTTKIVIVLPGIDTSNMQGFLNNENIVRRLDKKEDLLYIANIVGALFLTAPIDSVHLNRYADFLIDDYKSCLKQKDVVKNNTEILTPDSSGYYTATVVEERFANANYRCLKISGLLPLNQPYEPNETHWLFFSKTLYSELKKGDKVRFIPSEIKPIRHFSDLKSTRNIYISHLEII